MKYSRPLIAIICIILSAYIFRQYYTVVVYSSVSIDKYIEYGGGTEYEIGLLASKLGNMNVPSCSDSIDLSFDGLDVFRFTPTIPYKLSKGAGESKPTAVSTIDVDAESIWLYEMLKDIGDSIVNRPDEYLKPRVDAVAIFQAGVGSGLPLFKTFYYDCKVSYYGKLEFRVDSAAYSAVFKFEEVYGGGATVSGLVSEDVLPSVILEELNLEEKLAMHVNKLRSKINAEYDCHIYLKSTMGDEFVSAINLNVFAQ
ncbi:MAG: hypothetical protein HWE14_05850 [Flavobacteriia bacterium]|nr:hypothetical protein [Flavobacteriia bacterium]